jgi:hypothetical protein
VVKIRPRDPVPRCNSYDQSFHLQSTPRQVFYCIKVPRDSAGGMASACGLGVGQRGKGMGFLNPPKRPDWAHPVCYLMAKSGRA